MSYPIKTSISSNEDIYDMNGQWLPKGNYYFSITRLTDNTAEGKLFERAFQATYKFKLRDIVRMMSGAQARLARRANIAHLNILKMKTQQEQTVTLNALNTCGKIIYYQLV